MEDVEDLSKMKVADLKKQLKSRGLSVIGNKTQLVERLQEALLSDDKPMLDASGVGDEDEYDEEEILAADDDDVGKLTQEEEAAALAGKLIRVKNDSLLISETQPEKKKISLKRSEPTLSHVPENNTTVSTTTEEADSAAEAKETKTNSTDNKENAAEAVPGEPKHKIIKLSDSKTNSSNENALEIRAKKFGITSDNSSDEIRKETRASRFGITATETKPGVRKAAPKLSMETGGTDMEKLKKRAERFGEITSKTLTKLETLEKLKDRQNRFGSTDSDKDSKDTKTVIDSDTTAKENKPDSTEKSTDKPKKVQITAPTSSEEDPKVKRSQRFAAK